MAPYDLESLLTRRRVSLETWLENESIINSQDYDLYKQANAHLYVFSETFDTKVQKTLVLRGNTFVYAPCIPLVITPVGEPRQVHVGEEVSPSEETEEPKPQKTSKKKEVQTTGSGE